MTGVSKTESIYVAGHTGMVGSAIVKFLGERGYGNLLLRTRQELDLTNVLAVEKFFKTERPGIVVLAAARVGGIQANIDHPAEFLYENLCIQNNVIHQAYLWRSRKFLFLASSCIYPKYCPQPMREEHLLNGPLEPTNEGYAIAKITGLKMVEYYRRQYGVDGITVIPCNLYGPNDSFHPVNSHVLSALVKKFVDAADDGGDRVVLWGSGIARREFLHVADAARAIVFLMEDDDPPGLINIGSGEDISIKELAALIARLAGFQGEVVWDESRPDGMLRKCLDVSRLKSMAFKPEIDLENGIRETIDEYRKRNKHIRGSL